MQITTQIYMVDLTDYYYHGSDKEVFLKKIAAYKKLNLPYCEWDDTEGASNTYLIPHGERTVAMDKLKIAECAIESVAMTVQPPQDIRVDITQALQDMSGKAIELAVTGGEGNTYNSKCEVHMPGQALALYNDMLLMENACTDALQNELNNGWRIIAACPQPDQRRPDYILGRYNPERSPNDMKSSR